MPQHIISGNTGYFLIPAHSPFLVKPVLISEIRDKDIYITTPPARVTSKEMVKVKF